MRVVLVQCAAGDRAATAGGVIQDRERGASHGVSLPDPLTDIDASTILDLRHLRWEPILTNRIQDVDPGQRQVDWALPDPAGLTVEQIRPIRADIDGRVPRLLADLLAVRRPEEDR
jgi:arsenate reductase (thioredoxin)